ncbi:hypothetical protein [Microbulbifer sp. THAF38]|uniref:hypothetical protein n=1 Tax=Microbulbifer sp. THAF38 TaxID=2587856 RepID=UPI001268706A|nr:hypothetical protein [Microbulbifer sp. THAF38]QFT54590.1 hypothetical protein FIU95_08500 [Microbulbifer sp. THAF38]
MEHLSFLEKLRAVFLLSAWGCSILFIVGAPNEVEIVYSVKNTAPEKLRIEKAYLTSESCGVGKKCDRIKFEATNLATNSPVEERIDAEPGIFPFGVSIGRKQIWSTERSYLEEFNVGEVYDAYLASNGRYYLSQGSYFPFAYLLAFSVLWLVGNAVVIANRL